MNQWMEANAFDLLRDYADACLHHTIILDPPAFARGKKNLPAALRGYKEMNLRAMKMLRPGGTLVTCSCSFAVSEDEFLTMLGRGGPRRPSLGQGHRKTHSGKRPPHSAWHS